MGWYEERILPWCIELSCGMKELVPERRKATAGLFVRVVEIGFGSGLNLPHYPKDVEEVIAVDPSTKGRELARRRVAAAPFRVSFVGLDAQRLMCPDASADAALSTFTLCTVPDAAQVLAELKRVLRPGARLHFLEHGLAPDAGVARWQRRLNGLQQKIAGGCRLDRDPPALLSRAGFRLEWLENRYLPGAPKTHGYLYLGAAQNIAA